MLSSYYFNLILIFYMNNIEMDQNKGGHEINENNNKMPRKSNEIKYELNEIGSWLCSYPVYGDVILCSINSDGFKSYTERIFSSTIQSSLPSGLWTVDSISKHFLNMPLYYHRPSWELLRTKVPTVILQEIMTRRTIEGGYKKEVIICDNNDNGTDDDILIYEDVPLNGWWKIGARKYGNNNNNNNNSNNNNNLPKKVQVKKIKIDRIKIKIILPSSPGLFSASGQEFISTSEVERGSAEAADCLQEVALQALWEIQKCGEYSLRSVKKQFKTFFYSNSMIVDDFMSNSKKRNNSVNNSSFHENNNEVAIEKRNDNEHENYHDSASSSSSTSSSLPSSFYELGEENECTGEKNDNQDIKENKKIVQSFIFQITPIKNENKISHKKAIKCMNENIKNKKSSGNKNSEEREESPKRARLSQDGLGYQKNICAHYINEIKGQESEVDVAAEKEVKMDLTVGDKGIEEMNISTGVRSDVSTTVRASVLNDFVPVENNSVRSCTVRTVSNMGILPIELENQLNEQKIGTEILVDFSSSIKNLFEKFFHSISVNDQFDTEVSINEDDMKNMNNSNDNNNNNSNNENESVSENNYQNENNENNENNEKGVIHNLNINKFEKEEFNKTDIENEEIYSFKIKLISKEKLVDTSLSKKLKPNLFYPSLSVQVSTYVHIFFSIFGPSFF